MAALLRYSLKQRSSFCILFSIFLLTGCGGGGSSDSGGDSSETATNSAPVISELQFLPASPASNTDLIAGATVSDSDGDSVTVSYAWSVNENSIQGASTRTLSSEYFTKGDTVTVSVVASDGARQATASLSITIANTAPVISSMVFTPSSPTTTSPLSIAADLSDIDGDSLDVGYSWSVNESHIAGADTSELAPENFKKDDVVSVVITASDGTDETTGSLSVTIADSPPTISVSGAPDKIPFDATANFQVDVVDPDGDPFEYRFLARPNGMAIDGSGQISWSPSVPLFTRETDFSWEITVVQDQKIHTDSVAGIIRVVDDLRRPPLSRSGLITPTENSPDMMIFGDFDLNGSNEVLVSDGKQRLYLLAHNGTDYEQVWMYPFALTKDGAGISAIHTAKKGESEKAEIIVGTGHYRSDSDADLLVIDITTKEITREVSLDGKSIDSILSGDLDGDGKLEYVLLVYGNNVFDEMHLLVLDADTLATEWRSPALKLGFSMALGQFDNDANPEIATSGGYVYGFENGEYQNLWAYGPGFGLQLEAGDLDADGTDELVGLASSGPSRLQIFSPSSKSLLLADESLYIDDFTIGDISPSSGEEILAISDWDMSIKSLSLNSEGGYSLNVNWSPYAEGRARSNPIFGDMDNDGDMEMAWASGWGEKFYVASLGETSVLEWQTPIAIVENAPVIGGDSISKPDGSKSLLFFAQATEQTGSTGYYTGIQMDPADGTLSWTKPLGDRSRSSFAAEVADIDGDEVSEFFFAAERTSGTYSLVSDTVAWAAPALPEKGIKLASHLINDDAYSDFALITETGYLYTIDAFNQSILGGFDTGVYPMGLVLKDTAEQDGVEFIVASMPNIRVFRQTPDGAEVLHSVVIEDLSSTPGLGDVAQYFASMLIVDMAVGDIDGDGSVEIFAATESALDYWVLVFSEDLKLQAYYPVKGEISAIKVEDFGGPARNLMVALRPKGALYHYHSQLHTLDPWTGREVSRSPELLGIIDPGNLHFVDLNKDGVNELSYGTRFAMNVTR